MGGREEERGEWEGGRRKGGGQGRVGGREEEKREGRKGTPFPHLTLSELNDIH